MPEESTPTGTMRERVRRAILHEETDIIPYQLGMKPELREAIGRRSGGGELLNRIQNHVATGPRPEWVRQELGDGRHVMYLGSVMQDPPVPTQAAFTVAEPALPEPTLSGYRFPDPWTVPFTPYPETDGFVMSGCLAHLESASYMRGFQQTWLDFVENPTFLSELMDGITDFVLGVIDRACAWDIDCFQIGDDWGSQRGLLISPAHWRRFIKPGLTRLVERVKHHGKYVGVHSDGDIGEVLDELVDMGVDILNPVQPECMDVRAVKTRYRESLTIYGGLSVQSIIPFGTPSEVAAHVRDSIRELGEGGGLILTPAKEMRAEVPVENAVAVIEELSDQR